jgi:hypothetical protein
MQLQLYSNKSEEESEGERLNSQDLVMEIRQREYPDYNSKPGEVIDCDDIDYDTIK